MTQKVLFLIAAFTFISTASFAAEAPCADKRKAKHDSRKALHECLKSWMHEGKDGIPSDDCTAKLSSFTGAVKDFHACREEVKAKREAKQKEKASH